MVRCAAIAGGRRRRVLAGLALLGACVGAEVEPEPVDSEPRAPVDSEVGESEPPVVDSEGVDNEGVDSEPAETAPPPPRVVPVDWGPGLVEISGEILGPDGWVPDPGRDLPGDAFVPPQAMSAFPVDLDGDGVEEVVVSLRGGQVGHVPRSRAYVQQAGGLVQASAGLSARIPAHAGLWVGAVDVDGDGLVDLVGDHWQELVAFGRAGGGFEAPWGVVPDEEAPWTQTGTLTLADLDHDGWLDLVVGAGDCQRTLLPALRTGPRSWSFDLRPIGGGVGRTHALTTVPQPDGSLLVVASTIACTINEAVTGLFSVQLDPDDDVRLLPASVDPVGPSWVSDPAFSQRTRFTQVMPMGVLPDDIDHDGVLDLWHALGLMWVGVWQGQAGAPYLDRSFDAFVQLGGPTDGFASVPWGAAAPDLDQDGRNDLIGALGDDDTSFQQLGGSPVHNRAWWHGDPWRYEEVSAAIGLTALGSWHGLVLADLDHDGDADPLFGGFGDRARVYRNEIALGHHGLALRLRGTSSNHLGLGAVVRVEVPGLPDALHQLTLPGNPFSQQDPLLFIGTGVAPVAARLTVVWPSGTEQVLEQVATGQLLEVEEPPVFEITPVGRHLPAGGAAAAELRVTPRLADGRVDAAAVVAVAVDGGASVTAPVWQDGAWVVQVGPAAVAGSSRVGITVNGVELPLRPKLWWDAP